MFHFGNFDVFYIYNEQFEYKKRTQMVKDVPNRSREKKIDMKILFCKVANPKENLDKLCSWDKLTTINY